MELIVTIINIAAALFLAGLCNGRMDYIKLHGLDYESWKDKWEWIITDLGEIRQPYIKKWYYFGLFAPKYKEMFAYSSTILVFLTDEWHLKKWLCFACIEFAICYLFIKAYNLPWWCIPIGIILLKTFRGLGFTLNYDKK